MAKCLPSAERRPQTWVFRGARAAAEPAEPRKLRRVCLWEEGNDMPRAELSCGQEGAAVELRNWPQEEGEVGCLGGASVLGGLDEFSEFG